MSSARSGGLTEVDAIGYWALGPQIDRADIPALCDELCALVLDRGATEVVCDLSRVAPVDMSVVDALARLTLTARRLGCRLRFEHAPDRLLALLVLTGLLVALPVNPSDEARAEAGELEPP